MDVSLVTIILVTLVLHQEFGHNTVEGNCSNRDLKIPNGSGYLNSGKTLARFECDRGFQLYGSIKLVCFGSQWSNDPPRCIANTCSEIVPTAALLVAHEYEGAVLKFTCDAMYKLNGTSKLVCNGTDWSQRQPTCDHILHNETSTTSEKSTTVFSTMQNVSTAKPTTPLPTIKTHHPTKTMKTKTHTTITTATTPPTTPTSKPDNTTIDPVKITRSFEQITSTSRKTSDETTKDGIGTESTTLKPVINSDLQHSNSHVTLKEDRHGTSNIVYIIIGVGLVLATAVLLVVGIYCYRRRHRLRRQSLESLSSSNPFYTAVNEEAAINIAMDLYEN